MEKKLLKRIKLSLERSPRPCSKQFSLISSEPSSMKTASSLKNNRRNLQNRNRTKPLRNRNILVEPISIIIPVRLRRPIRNPERTRIPVPRPHPRKIPFSIRCKITQRENVRTLGSTTHFRRIKTLFRNLSPSPLHCIQH